MAARIVVRRILLATNQQLGVEELSVITGADLINGTRVQIDKDGSGDIFARAGFSKHGIELSAIMERFRVRVRTPIVLEAMLEEVAVGCQLGGEGAGREDREDTYSSQALFPSWVPAWPM
jgi:hypothetical protein